MQYREEQQRLAKIAAIGYSHVIKDTMFKPNPWLRFLKFKRGGKPMKQK